MHQTTIRFGHELWDSLEGAAEQGGVSVAQYVREAAIERLARSGVVGSGVAARRLVDAERSPTPPRENSNALTAQSKLATTRSRQLRAQAQGARSVSLPSG